MFLRLGLLFSAAVLAAQQPYSWNLNPPPVQEFSLALAKVREASTEKIPFQSIRGEYDPQAANWYTISLPGSFGCRLFQVSKPYQWEYRCLVVGSESARLQTYQNMEKLVRDSRADWKFRPKISFEAFFYQDEDSPVVYVSGRTMSLHVYPPLNK